MKPGLSENAKEWGRGAALPGTRAIAAMCAIGIVAAAWWALVAPLRAMPVEYGSSSGAVVRAVAPREDRALDIAAFRVPIWVAPPAPPPPPAVLAVAKPAPEPPAAALKWQLLAIVEEGMPGDGAGRRALLYDPDADLIIELRSGEQHSGREMMSIAEGRIAIRHGKHTHTLSLDPRSASAAGGAP